METMSPSSTVSGRLDGSTFDESSMHQHLLFSDSLKDLKNLRSQLYSAAEYFELSYTNDDQKQIVVNTLKDYAVMALVNTVDHLGSVSFKVNGFLDEKVDEVLGTELRVSGVEQRLQTCQEYIDREGRSQQSLLITAPKYHKHYIIPVGASMPESGRYAVARNDELIPPPVDDFEMQQFQAAVRTTIRVRPPTIRDRPPSFRKTHSPSPSPRARSSSPSVLRSSSPSTRPGKNIVTDKRAVSPLRASSPFARSGSMSSRAIHLNTSNSRRRFPTEPQKSSSVRLHAERNEHKEGERNPSKSRSFLKSLLTRRRSQKDEMLYNYLDEY